jgi:GntR family transcriptional regulator
MARPKYQSVADALRADIQSGAIRAGFPLPSTAELRAKFNVGAGAVREAIIILIGEKLVVTEGGVARYAMRLPTPEERSMQAGNPSTTGTPSDPAAPGTET